jgi:hypothetical protein
MPRAALARGKAGLYWGESTNEALRNMPAFSQAIFTILIFAISVVLQLIAQLTLDRVTAHMPRAGAEQFAGFRKMAFTLVAVVILMCGHIGQVTIWATRYYAWGDLGSFANAFYFSLTCFTTLGASELELSQAHRFAGAIESALGMLMFGWSTALLFQVVQRVDREHSANSAKKA